MLLNRLIEVKAGRFDGIGRPQLLQFRSETHNRKRASIITFRGECFEERNPAVCAVLSISGGLRAWMKGLNRFGQFERGRSIRRENPLVFARDDLADILTGIGVIHRKEWLTRF
jgi:hypothetical protein